MVDTKLLATKPANKESSDSESVVSSNNSDDDTLLMSQETKPNATINLQHSKRQPFNLTATDQAEIELLSLCQNIGAPLYAYDAIMKWACDASLRGHVFTPGTGSRKQQTVLYELYDRFDMNGTLPVLKQVTPRQSVVIFDFNRVPVMVTHM